MVTPVTTRLTLDEFLALPETEPASEFIRGEVVQKPMPSFLHGLIVATLAQIFGRYFSGGREGLVSVEVRHSNRDEGRSYVPDAAVLLASHIPRDARMRDHGPLDYVPDIAIEVLSPDDRPGRVTEKVAFYLRAGTPIVWLIDPIDRTLTEHRPISESRVYTEGESVSAAPILPGFTLELDELFSVVPG